MNGTTHPARSLEFLSRLHDGELTAAERAHFESHRAHCDECRQAAAGFEQALSAYRTAGTPLPRGDLAARILRSLEAANPRRRTFGVVFGIDLKWAGAFTSAILAVLAGYAVLGRRTSERPIPIRVALPTAVSRPAPAAPPSAEAPSAAEPAKGKVSRADRRARPAPGETPPPAPAMIAKEEKSAPAAAAARSSAANSAADAVAPAPRRTIHVSAADDSGPPPAILNPGEISLAPADRGRYDAVIGADGVPVEIAPASDSGTGRRPASPAALEALKKLRFEAGRQPRRVLIVID